MNNSQSTSPEPIVSIRNLTKKFNQFVALDNVSLDIYPGEIFALLGPSGCGKSTLLRLMSGFETPSSGEMLLDGTDLIPLKPNKRPINMVFQSYAVFPHMSVEDNVAYGLKMEGVGKADIKVRVEEALEQVHMAELAKRKPHQLSGGQRQRVALARVLVKKPRLLLLDEPLSALDAKLRDAMRLELVKLQEAVGITFVIVTHDQSEAMAIADRIAVLDEGKLRQVATPPELYQKPVDAFVADFVGTMHTFELDRINFDTGNDANSIGSVAVSTPELGQLNLTSAAMGTSVENISSNPSDSVLAVRPEHISVSITEPMHSNTKLLGQLGDIAFQGQHSIVEIMLSNRSALTAIVNNNDAQQLHASGHGSPVWAHWDTDQMLLLPKNARS